MIAVVLTLVCYLLVLARLHNLKRRLKLYQRRRRGYIYGFTDKGQLLPLVKIGRATDPVQRMRSHKTAAPFGLFVFFILRVPDDVQAERSLHELYARWRVGHARPRLRLS